MTDFEKVVKGLECCYLKASCTECPYDEYGRCVTSVAADAIALLKEQQEEIQRLCDALKPEPPKEENDDRSHPFADDVMMG